MRQTELSATWLDIDGMRIHCLTPRRMMPDRLELIYGLPVSCICSPPGHMPRPGAAALSFQTSRRQG